ncbi:deoxynucleoside kinase [Pantoea alhagi]|uniref:Deoxynucleoside kinase n=1 Tax=Pantoea alhagi TaxID=1891675 RepID=A0A1W6B5T4_9GAMM|nr:deoxynucleoside kinase [Pantoea alhagi]ARJ42450.1 deoxynucleoside kinase [Pantoea alhagi]
MKIITIEANIAAGKSSLIGPLAERLTALSGESWQVMVEPVDGDPQFLALLQAFISSPGDADARIRFQLYITRMRQQLLKDLPDGNYLIERSLYSDVVFCHANFLHTERPDAAYMDYYYQIKTCLSDYPPIDVVLYIDRCPQACFDSCMARGRPGEAAYTLDYFLDLKRFHDACLPQLARAYPARLITCPVGSGFADADALAALLVQQTH